MTATSEGKAASAAVTVAPAGPVVSTVTVTPANSKPKVGSAVTLTATCRDATGTTISGLPVAWSMTATKAGVASFIVLNASQIRVQALKEGTATFTATCGGKSGSTNVQVQAD